MDEDSKVIPMRPLREVLTEFEAAIEQEERTSNNDGPCPMCNGTGTEIVHNEQTKVTSARRCQHQ